MMSVLEERRRCPACDTEDSISLFRAAYHEPRMQTFLQRKFRKPREIVRLLSGRLRAAQVPALHPDLSALHPHSGIHHAPLR